MHRIIQLKSSHIFLFFIITLQVGITGCNRRSEKVVNELSAATYTSTTTTQLAPREATHIIRLHVVVDRAYRREQLRWRDRVEETIQFASDELFLLFRVRLEVTSIDEWDYDSKDTSLRQVLRDVRAAYPVNAEREDRVLALTSALPSPSNNQHKLGVAYELGEHLVLRGMQDFQEQEWIKQTLTIRTKHLSDKIYKERYKHKQITVLLHELGHTFGAMHITDPEQIMSSFYDHKSNGFAPINTILLEEAFKLDQEMGQQPHQRWQQAMIDMIVSMREQRDPLLSQIPGAELDDITSHHKKPRPEQAPNPHYDTLVKAQKALNNDDLQLTWETLEPLLALEKPPYDAIRLGCYTQFSMHQENIETEHPLLHKLCLQLSKISDDVEPTNFALFALSNHLLSQDEYTKAFVYAQMLEENLNAQSHVTSEQWLDHALTYKNLGALTYAEKLTQKAGMTSEAAELRQQIRYRRHTHGIFDLKPEQENLAYALVQDLYKAHHDKKPKDEEIALKKLEQLYPDSALLHSARCAHAMNKRKRASIKKFCTIAAQKVPQNAKAHYGLGVSYLIYGKDKKAVASLKHSIELEPELHDTWKVLARHYKETNNTEALGDLQKRYKERFDEELTWTW